MYLEVGIHNTSVNHPKASGDENTVINIYFHEFQSLFDCIFIFFAEKKAKVSENKDPNNARKALTDLLKYDKKYNLQLK